MSNKRKNARPESKDDLIELVDKINNTNAEQLPIWQQWLKCCLPYLDHNFCGSIKRDFINIDEQNKIFKDNNGMSVGPRTTNKYFILSINRNSAANEYVFSGVKQFDKIYHIPLTIRKYYENIPCVYTNISNTQIDHKYDYCMEFYENEQFNENIDNYQPLIINLNDKKRELKKVRIDTGYKTDNTIFNCYFSTLRHKLKFDKNLYTMNDPYNGEFFTDIVKTIHEDRLLAIELFNKIHILVQDINFYFFKARIVPIINFLIKDQINIHEHQEIIEGVLQILNL